MRLERLTWPKAKAYFDANDTVVVPIGSLECHGRHMPLGTDTMIPNRILDKLEEKSDVLIAPTVPYGNTDYLASFPGTVSLGPEVTYQVMYRILDGLRKHGARRFVILNGHGGNNPVLDRLSVDMQEKDCILVQMNWWIMVWDLVEDWKGDRPWRSGHGGAEETAAVMAIDPSLIDTDEIRDLSLKELSEDLPFSTMAHVRYKGVDIPVRRFTTDVSDNGWVGPDHPKYATAEWGEKMIEASASYIADFIEVLKKVQL
ncbi:MAG: creatininase family protein [Solobacterium sp.]|nr:creatininase family protein [Solobacterium sp.]